MHVLSIAEKLEALGNNVVILIPDSLETLKRHRATSIKVALYDDARRGFLPFREDGVVDIVHAWTPREHVRKIAEDVARLKNCPYVLHMEDNEEQIVSDELHPLNFDKLKTLAPQYQNALTSPYRAHPTRYRDFAEKAAGYTCLMDRLLEFKPPSVPGVVFWPGFDDEFEVLPKPDGAREKYGIAPDDIIVFYSGNVHRSIEADVRNLYLAVAAHRRRGVPIRLLRTGWNQSGINDALSQIAKAADFIELGFVDRSEVPVLLGLSDILVQPGKSDAFNDYRFPSKLTEYLVSGKPVILPASNIGHALEEGRHVLKLHDGTLSELIGKINTLLDDPALSARLGRESRAFALSELRWEKAAAKVDALYKSIVAKARTGPSKPSEHPSAGPASVATGQHPVQLVAFYLPQFHPIPENDKWWGKGFTEWTNVSRARPQMVKHRQPRIPADLGYYDLRVVETMHEQAKLAAQYGVSGFCFYVYWFEGRRLLEKPVDLWLEKGPDFPFCICWANENWSRRWDGSETDILMSQDYAPGFEERFIVDMLPILKDPRYIRVNGAPILSIYRVSEFPDPPASARAFREAAVRHGIPELHLVMIQSFGLTDPRPYGFDAAVEFSPPHTNRLLLDPSRVEGVNDDFAGYLEDYVGVAAQSINAPPTDYARYRGCFPMWDNTARRGKRGHIFVNDSPKAYAQWLRFLVHEAMVRQDQVQPMVFINAWNEWAEGTYLEPDVAYGHALLEVTQTAMTHGVVDFVTGGTTPEREREFVSDVARLPRMERK